MKALDLEEIVKAEFREGVSAGAAARQVAGWLDAKRTPYLKRMIEDLLAETNRRSHDRSRILRAFKDVAPDEAVQAELASFARLNGRGIDA